MWKGPRSLAFCVIYTYTGPFFFLLRDLELHAHWPHRYHCIIIKLENPRIICHLYLLDTRVNLGEQIMS
jgi:hypothetical protein